MNAYHLLDSGLQLFRNLERQCNGRNDPHGDGAAIRTRDNDSFTNFGELFVDDIQQPANGTFIVKVPQLFEQLYVGFL